MIPYFSKRTLGRDHGRRAWAGRLVGATMVLISWTAMPVMSYSQKPPTSPRESMWKKVNDAVAKGLPKTAVEALGPIIDSALADKAYPEAIKGIVRRVVLQSEIEGNKPEEHILRMQQEIENAPLELTPLLRAVLANFYWGYFESNRHRFGQRTTVAAPSGPDITTWDLSRIFTEIDQLYDSVLADEATLREIPIASYDLLIPKETMPDKYRPTLFDFVAFLAIEFYASGEQAGLRREDAFELDASSPALGTVTDFLAWKPNTSDDGAPKLKALRLYQRLLAMHADSPDRSAYLDADLGRLQFAHSIALGEEKGSRYQAALKAFAETNAKHELSATARYRLAELLYAQSEPVLARDMALQGMNAFPASAGGLLCQSLIQRIESKSLSVSTERVWNDPQPNLRVTYRNVNKVYFRAIQLDWASRFGNDRWNPSYLNGNDQAQLLQLPVALAWSADLPPTEDYREATFDVPAPKDLKPGYYFILSSAAKSFSDDDNVIAATDVWVSNLSIVLRQAWGTGKLEGFVLNAKTGEPIAKAKVRLFVRQNQNNQIKEQGSVATDDNGLFTITTVDQNVLLLASHNGHELATQNEHRQSFQNQISVPSISFVLFTDRSIYRPGQTVQCTGVALLADQENGKYVVVPNQKASVEFRDVNGTVIETVAVRTNEYGSFSASFTTPRDRGTGTMSLAIDNGASGYATVQVEEYKRPKFQVTLDPPKNGSKLNEEVTVEGKAMSYTGAAINGAKVRYRVIRQVRWPAWFLYWHAWRLPPNDGAGQEIAHGWATTEPDGSFRISFVAKPDRSVPESDGPNFHFQINADVTDSTGETRTGTSSVSIGYVALQADISAAEFLQAGEEIKLSIRTTTLDGQSQSTKGTVKIHRLQEPQSVLRPDLLGQRVKAGKRNAKSLPRVNTTPDPSLVSTWKLGDVVETLPFATPKEGTQDLRCKLERGLYRAILESQDAFGKPVRSEWDLTVLDPKDTKLGINIPNKLVAPRWSLEPGMKLSALWGTGYETGRAFIEIEHRGKLLQSYWTKPGVTQVAIEQAIDEAMRGGLTLRTTFVRENRAYLESRSIDVPWSNKALTLQWEHFVSKLEPGRQETFALKVSGPDASKVVGEMVATLYDASLDAYMPHAWTQRFNVFRQERTMLASSFENDARFLNVFRGGWKIGPSIGQASYRKFSDELGLNRPMTMMFSRMYKGVPGGGPAPTLAAPMAMNMATRGGGLGMDKDGAEALSKSDYAMSEASSMVAAPTPRPDLTSISPRTNLNETAFFFPQVQCDADGNFRLEFTMPEALTTWRFMGFVHDKDLRSGYLEDKVVSSKDLMVQPNPPRFLREGDALEFSVKVTNLSSQSQSGQVALQLFDARTNQIVDPQFGNHATEQPFEVAAGESKSYVWKLTVPNEAYPIIYKAVGGTGTMSDGEEGMLPVLSKQMLVTESIPLPIRDASTKQFRFNKLLESGESDTLKHQSLTVQMVSQPAWYAVLALPYLMEYPYDCSEQTFNRLYANALAEHIANSDPKIRRVFDTWRTLQPEALDSPLMKNQDIKSVMIEETPWLRAAQKESQSRRNVGILFDANRLANEKGRALRRLSELQRDNGMWPWFPGGPDNEYLSLYIITGFGRMRHLGVQVDESIALKGLARMDAWMTEQYEHILKHSPRPDENHLNASAALYLYGRSFFLQDRPIAEPHMAAIDYWKRQASKYWLTLGNRQSQAHIAIGLARFNDPQTPRAIVDSLREHAVTNEEMGMFWRDTETSWWWYHAPIETQAMMIEAFDEVAGDAQAVQDCKVWLLKQKQTQDWKTTKSTADAVYALLLRRDNLLGSDALVQVKLANNTIDPKSVEAGTGFYEQTFVRGEIKPEFGTVTLTKTDPGVSWGSLHWQYLEDISKITPHAGTPLKLEKRLFKQVFTKTGPSLEPVDGPLNVGDEIVCRIVLRTDRDMEYVHLKDHRGSGTEPVNVLSRYKFQDGLAYYESTRDTASHFFIDYLPKGSYVFEYTLRVQHAGTYPTGMASIECMYAPEFNSHSESILLNVVR